MTDSFHSKEYSIILRHGLEKRLPIGNMASHPYRIGITGTIGSGKTLLGECLREEAIPVLDTDHVVAELYRTDTALKDRIAEAFGPDALTRDGEVNKPMLRNLIFTDPHQKHRLEALVHPAVESRVAGFFAKAGAMAPLCAGLVPLLFEAGAQAQYDETWAVVVYPEETLLQRLMQREGWTVETARNRLNAQWSQAEKSRYADRIIDNSGSREETVRQVRTALTEIREQLR